MDKVIINDLHTYGIIGIKQDERQKKQEILINCTLFTDTRLAGKEDSIKYTINYSSVAKAIQAIVSQSTFFTVEALAAHICECLFSEFRPDAIRLRVEKTQVVKAAKSVGVEIFRRSA